MFCSLITSQDIEPSGTGSDEADSSKSANLWFAFGRSFSDFSESQFNAASEKNKKQKNICWHFMSIGIIVADYDFSYSKR